MNINKEYTGLEVAVVGMAGRFPNAINVIQFWKNLINNEESITFFTNEELLNKNISPKLISDPNYIKAKGVFPNLEYFDNHFFGYTPKDAELMDPQVRALHEEVFHALEDAGYTSENSTKNIGIFVGAANNFPWEVSTFKQSMENSYSHSATMQMNDKDFVATRIAYSLNLTGPCVSFQTACSTSLYAVDIACRNLLTGACEMAVAGGTDVTLPQEEGYYYQDGMIRSVDGHCRPFDGDATGTVEGNGVGAVVLKTLEDAIRDGDNIYAVIKGFASNNDGSRKVGFTAPSIEGQSEVIEKALNMAEVSPSSISYVETHGTGTAIGDPIELGGLKGAYKGVDKHSCGIGSVKSNIGHMDTAAGIASFIKTVLSVKNKVLPASININEVNKELNIEETPFYLVTENTQLKNKEHPDSASFYPIRTGVSSFGIGGTNVHVILEEFLEDKVSTEPHKHNLFYLSAMTEDSLNHMVKEHIDFIEANKDVINESDLSYSLLNHRKSYPVSIATAYETIDELLKRLRNIFAEKKYSQRAKQQNTEVFFMFPGQGSQYRGMAQELYKSNRRFKEIMDQCFDICEKKKMENIKTLFLDKYADSNEIKNTNNAQLLLFVTEYSLSVLLKSLGVVPKGMIGHSLGEYVCACISGVMSREDAIALIVVRGKCMQSIQTGSMLSVNKSFEEVQKLLVKGVELSADNTPEQVTVSGNDDSIQEFIKNCDNMGIQYKKLHTSHAFHSYMMEGAKEEFLDYIKKVNLNMPKLPYISNLTGNWITEEEAVNPHYYVEHMCNCVKFRQGIETLNKSTDAIYIEIGAGWTLSNFVRQNVNNPHITAVNLIKHANETEADEKYLLNALGKLVNSGLNINWNNYFYEEVRNRISLPLYHFEKTVHPVDVRYFREMINDISLVPHTNKTYKAGNGQLEYTEWVKSFKVKNNSSYKSRVILSLSNRDDLIKGLDDRMKPYKFIPVTAGNDYKFEAYEGALIESNEFHLWRLFKDMRTRRMIPDLMLIAFDNSEDTKLFIRLVADYLNNTNQTGLMPILVIAPLSAHLQSKGYDLITLVQTVRMEYEELDIRLYDWDDTKDISVISKDLKYEINCTIKNEVVVDYRKDGRYVLRCMEILNNSELTDTFRGTATYIRNVASKSQLIYPKSVANNCNIRSIGYYMNRKSEFPDIQLVQKEINFMESQENTVNMFKNLDQPHKVLDEIAVTLVFHCIDSKFNMKKGETFSKDQLKEVLIKDNQYIRYIDLFINMLTESGAILPKGQDVYEIKKDSDDMIHYEALTEQLGDLDKTFLGQAELLKYCADNLLDVFEGTRSGLSVLYPEARNTLLQDFYIGSFEQKETHYVIEVFYNTLKTLVKKCKKVRILEVGGGYGLVTREISELIKQYEIEYYFTDITTKYLDDFMNYSMEQEIPINFKLFDISQSAVEQGFEEGTFDIILGYNVLHTTFNIKDSIANMKGLLKENGYLFILERVRQRNYTDLIWGLAKGWFDFDDTERNLSPIMEFKQWRQILEEVGFERILVLPDSNEYANIDMGILMGQQPQTDVFSHKDVETIINVANGKDLVNQLKEIKQSCDFLLIEEEPHTIITSDNSMDYYNYAYILAKELPEQKVIEICTLPERNWTSYTSGWYLSNSSRKNMENNLYHIYISENAPYTTEYLLRIVYAMIDANVNQLVINSASLPILQYQNIRKGMVPENESQISTNTIESMVIEMWKNLFGYNDINIDSNYFELGGDSFKEIQFIADLNLRGYKLNPKEIFKNQTVKEIANRINEVNKKDSKSITTVEGITKYIEKHLNIKCTYVPLEEENYIMALEDIAMKQKVLGTLKDLELDSDVLPSYILSVEQVSFEQVSYEQLIQENILKSFRKEQLEIFVYSLLTQEKNFNQSVLAKHIVSRYRLNNIQRLHFDGTTELQLYLIAFDEIVDIELLENALTDIITKYPTLRSYVTTDENGEDIWEEIAEPDFIKLPYLNLEGLAPEFQESIKREVNDILWKTDFKYRKALMFRVTLIKQNEKSYTLMFQFDHSIFDLSSGQAIRASLLKRYNDLKKGESHSIDFALDYKEYLKQLKKGPVNTSSDEILELFDGKKYFNAQNEIVKITESMSSEKIQHVFMHIDLTPFLEVDNNQDIAFELTIILFCLLVKKYIKKDYIAFDLLYQHRIYEDINFTDMVGFVMDTVPVYLEIDQENPFTMIQKLRELIAYVNKHNISFTNMVLDEESEKKWGGVLKAMGRDDVTSLRTPCLVNYTGRVEAEYTEVWEYSLTQLENDNQSKLDYGEFYALSKVTENTLEFLVLVKVESNMEDLRSFIKYKTDELFVLYKEMNVPKQNADIVGNAGTE